jgi:putative addiction module CopG family antidote
MARTTSFTLSEEDEAFIRQQIEHGEQQNASEVMRVALRRYRRQRQRMRALARQRARLTLPPISMLKELFALRTDEPAFANELEQHQAKTNEPAIVEDPWER